jgi:ribosome-associated protein
MAKTPSTRAKTSPALPKELAKAVAAAYGKKAEHVVALDLRKAQAFTDYFLICTGQSVRQVQAIADAVEGAIRQDGTRPAHVEGYERADWILLDYFTFVVHVFTPELRQFYDLERLWGAGVRIDVPDPAA